MPNYVRTLGAALRRGDHGAAHIARRELARLSQETPAESVAEEPVSAEPESKPSRSKSSKPV
jgi:hypothetical protein